MLLDDEYLLRPSGYTAALLRVIEGLRPDHPLGRTIEIGVGNGVVLAAIGRLGPKELWGVDLEPVAVEVADGLLARLCPSIERRVMVSDIWSGVPAARFDLVAANLPHHPSPSPSQSDRMTSWSGGGRTLVDRLIAELPDRLTSNGTAYVTHLDLIGLDQTLAILARLGLVARSVFEWTVYESADPELVSDGDGLDCARAAIRRYGRHCFAEARILEIRHLTSSFSREQR